MEIEKIHLTLKLMRSLTVGKNHRYCDTEVSGFQVWVGKRTISYYLRKRKDGKEYTLKIGNWPDIMLDEARQIALERLGALSNYGDIKAPTGRRNPTVKDAIEYYISTLETTTSIYMAKSDLKPYLHLSRKLICDIRKNDLESVHKAMAHHPRQANKCLTRILAVIHKFCLKMKIQFINPAEDIKRYEEKPRKRYITKEEMPRFFKAVEKIRTQRNYDIIADIIYMLIYTGARKTNVMEMELNEISESGLWTIPKHKFKTKREHQIQLGKREMKIIDKYRNGRKSGYVFPHEHSLNTRLRIAFNKVKEYAKINDLRIHDLRRTLGTWMLSSGAPIAVVSKKLGHSSIHTTEQVYAHITPDISVKATDDAIDAMFKTEKKRRKK